MLHITRHPWASGALTWMTENVVGVKPLKPGYREWQFKPRLFEGMGRTSTQGSAPTPNGGIIEVSIDIIKTELNVSVPLHTYGYIHIPIYYFGDDYYSSIGASKITEPFDVLINSKSLKYNVDFSLNKNNYNSNKDEGTMAYISLEKKLSAGKYTIKWIPKRPRRRITMASKYTLPPPYYKANFLGYDRSTKNNEWQQKYGKEGFIIFSPLVTGQDIVQLPHFISNYSTKIWEGRYAQGTFQGGLKDASSWK